MTLIVVVDDRSVNRTILSKLSSKLGDAVEVVAFADPIQALEGLANIKPDLIITDYNMPGINGADFIKKIRSDDNLIEVPIIVITAYEDKDYRYKALEAGASDFLLSPIDHQEFKRRAENLITLHQLRIKKTEEAAKREEDRFRSIVESVPLPVVVTSFLSGNVLYKNTKFLSTFGNKNTFFLFKDEIQQNHIIDSINKSILV